MKIEKSPVLKMPKMPSSSIITRNKLISDLLEMPSLSEADFEKGLALRSGVWEQDKVFIKEEMAEQEAIIQQAKAETDAISYTQGVLDGEKKAAREIQGIAKDYFTMGNYEFCREYLPYIVAADGRAIVEAIKSKYIERR